MTQRSLDAIKLAKDNVLESMKRRPIEKNSGFIINGSIAVVGGTGSGKTSLITKLMRLYNSTINGLTIFYFHNGDGMDQTMSLNTKQIFINNVNWFGEPSGETIVRRYIKHKKQMIEKAVELTGTIGDETVKSSLITSLVNENQMTVKTNGGTLVLNPLMISNNGKTKVVININPSLMIFDDLTQLGNYTGQYANSFLKELVSNTRHFSNTSIFGMQRYTYLQANVRRNINCWALGYGLSMDDLKTMLNEITTGRTNEEVINTYTRMPKYHFLIINPEFDVFEIIKLNY